MRLLISVVDVAEAIEAAAAGADIIDVKDPATGALGLAPPRSVRAIRDAIPAPVPISAALGDGPFEPGAAVAAAAAAAASGASFVKLGLRHMAGERALATLRAVRGGLPARVQLIVAGFADFPRADSPDPLDLPDLARTAGAQGCLIDTAVKDGRGLFHWMDEARLHRLVAACRARALLCALAGSLSAADLPRLPPIGADIAGVRGAACVGDRIRGRVSGVRVRALGVALRGEDTAHERATATTPPPCREWSPSR
jgi:hypothetical protein